MIWVLKGADGRIAIVDSGFHREQYFRQFTVRDYVAPSDAIGPLGIRPDQVTDIFLTHMHWDHAGGIDLFPSARVWLQKGIWSSGHLVIWSFDCANGQAHVPDDEMTKCPDDQIHGVIAATSISSAPRCRPSTPPRPSRSARRGPSGNRRACCRRTRPAGRRSSPCSGR
jgi:hypothetical protein